MGLMTGRQAVTPVARDARPSTGSTLVPPRLVLPEVDAARPSELMAILFEHLPELLGALIAVLGLLGRAGGVGILTVAAGLSLLPLGLISPRITLMAMCILVPQAELGVPVGPLGFHVMALFASMIGIALRLPFERFPVRLGLGAACLVVFVALAAVTLPAALVDLPIDRTKFAVSQLLQILGGAALFCGIAYVAARRSVGPYTVAALLSGVLACVATVMSTMDGWPAAFAAQVFATGPATLQRPVGVLANANYMGLLAATIGTGCIAFAVHRHALVRVLYFVGAACAIAAILLTFSRGAILALGAGVLTLAFAKSRPLGIGLASLLVIAAVIIYPAVPQRPADRRATATPATPTRPSARTSRTSRGGSCSAPG